ncbi:MAG TPA: SUMF1/EgtB/PvdO family nonheme iron enzyme [Armatimonadota bacterium]|nr:SUMF1/EgtB/PvdO family nonheme iron enzyme [Armatimonadota bacterium]
MHDLNLPTVAIIALSAIAALSASCQPAPSVRNTLGIDLMRVSAGRFVMGSDEAHWDQAPAHSVTISQAFLISATEVTTAQYRQFRPDADVVDSDGLVAGVSHNDAAAFCEWLSAKEGKPYRLPTEAEWEYACRAGTSTAFWSGDAPPDLGSANAWGLKGTHGGVLEWCHDWYGDYAAEPRTDPIGATTGLCRVIRGGGLDNSDPQYHTAANRAGMPPSFGVLVREQVLGRDPDAIQPGLLGSWYGDPDLTRPLADELLLSLSNDWSSDGIRGTAWSGQWRGLIGAPVTGEVRFSVEADRYVRVDVDDERVIDVWDGTNVPSGTLTMERGRKVPITVSYSHVGGPSFLKLNWLWEGAGEGPVPEDALWHRLGDEEGLTLNAADASGRHRIGFRVVQAPLPNTAPMAPPRFFVGEGVKQEAQDTRTGPSLETPYFRKRVLLPTPPETGGGPDYQATIDDAGLHPSFRGHNHSPALVACANGDLLMVIYTSYREYEPEVSLIAARLRHGADAWDMPSRFVDLPGANDHAPLLWNDDGRLFLFWGSPRLVGGYPFQWITSDDNGATWSEVRFPRFTGAVGPHSRQPINSAFRGPDDTIYVASDGAGGTSLLWASHDDGETWIDPGGRTFGRHTTFAQLDGGRILGMGGKNTDVGGYMPRSISADGGRSWEKSATPFPALGGNQRPSILRLQSGRLFFAGDLQRRGGEKPPGVAESGSYVALSDDEGETWHVKTLTAAQPHETPDFHAGANTIGYSAACQSEDGLIHLITTMNRPCLHFALNETWILSEGTGAEDAESLTPEADGGVTGVRRHRETDADGRTTVISQAGIGRDGCYRLHGRERWFYPNGRRQYRAEYRAGRKIGVETYWRVDGTKAWEWRHAKDGTSTWAQWWTNGRRKAESTWRDSRIEGPAWRWDRDGRLISERDSF